MHNLAFPLQRRHIECVVCQRQRVIYTVYLYCKIIAVKFVGGKMFYTNLPLEAISSFLYRGFTQDVRRNMN
jgi:hypothetical protein